HDAVVNLGQSRDPKLERQVRASGAAQGSFCLGVVFDVERAALAAGVEAKGLDIEQEQELVNQMAAGFDQHAAAGLARIGLIPAAPASCATHGAIAGGEHAARVAEQACAQQ